MVWAGARLEKSGICAENKTSLVWERVEKGGWGPRPRQEGVVSFQVFHEPGSCPEAAPLLVTAQG